VLKPFLVPIARSVVAKKTELDHALAAPAPYPASPVVAGIEWSPVESIVRLAKGSDNWPTPWADDDALYTAYGDGNGFAPYLKAKLSLGFAKVSGDPPAIAGENLRSESGEATGDGKKGRKASGILSVDGVLYLLVRNAENAQLSWSSDHGSTWSWADWKFNVSFGCPTFLNFGKDYTVRATVAFTSIRRTLTAPTSGLIASSWREHQRRASANAPPTNSSPG
jgi:hypothetical protein